MFTRISSDVFFFLFFRPLQPLCDKILNVGGLTRVNKKALVHFEIKRPHFEINRFRPDKGLACNWPLICWVMNESCSGWGKKKAAGRRTRQDNQSLRLVRLPPVCWPATSPEVGCRNSVLHTHSPRQRGKKYNFFHSFLVRPLCHGLARCETHQHGGVLRP